MSLLQSLCLSESGLSGLPLVNGATEKWPIIIGSEQCQENDFDFIIRKISFAAGCAVILIK